MCCIIKATHFFMEQIKKVLKMFSPAQAQHEALVAADFKISDEK